MGEQPDYVKLEIYCPSKEKMQELIKILEDNGIKLRRTDEFGLIRVEHHHYDLVE